MSKIKLTEEVAVALWRQALELELGLKFPIDPRDVERVKALMYTARRDAADDALDVLMLCVGPDAKEILLVKKSVEAP